MENFMGIRSPPKSGKVELREPAKLNCVAYKNDVGRRNQVENTFYRLKTIFGRKLLFRTIPNQDAESAFLCTILNKMTELGMPKSVKIA
jgi:hypothetical protein